MKRTLKTALLISAALAVLCSCTISKAPTPPPVPEESSSDIIISNESVPEEPAEPLQPEEETIVPSVETLEHIDIPKDKMGLIKWIMDEKTTYPIEGAEYDREIDVHLFEVNLEGEDIKAVNSKIREDFYEPVVKAISATEREGPCWYFRYSSAALYKNYLSVRVNSFFAPNYGTSGDVYTAVIDTERGVVIPFEMVVADMGVDLEKELALAHEAICDANPMMTVEKYFKCENIFIESDGSVNLICEWCSASPEADESWKHVYTYNINRRELTGKMEY